jgi:hypothetical protein
MLRVCDLAAQLSGLRFRAAREALHDARDELMVEVAKDSLDAVRSAVRRHTHSMAERGRRERRIASKREFSASHSRGEVPATLSGALPGVCPPRQGAGARKPGSMPR